MEPWSSYAEGSGKAAIRSTTMPNGSSPTFAPSKAMSGGLSLDWQADVIAGATRGAGGAALARHLLSRKGGQEVRVLGARHLIATDLSGQIRELVASARHGRTDRPIHHVHVDPPPGFDAESVMKSFVTHYEREFGLREAARCGVRHGKKGRTHCHLVYSLVRPDGRVASLSHEYARREKVSRIVEFECGLPWTKGKHNRAVHAALMQEGREDVAAAMEAGGLLSGSRPVADQTPREREQAERTEIPLADVRSAALAAWRASDSAAAFEIALSEHGLRLAAGDRGVVVIDRSGGTHSLTRILSAAARAEGGRITTADVRQRLASGSLQPREEMANAGPPEPQPGSHARPVAAGDPVGPNINPIQPGENVMKFGFRSRRKQNYKSQLLSELAPDFDSSPWADDLHRIDRDRSVPRIELRDRGWVELDAKAGIVRTWGKPGRAIALAKEIAEAQEWHVETLRPTGDLRASPEHASAQRSPDDVATWWRERGYDAVTVSDGVWIDAGSARLQDIGDQVRLHGPLTPEAARALIIKVSEAWGGDAELSGPWTQADKDVLWLEAQRSGVRLGFCEPSAKARAAWEAEVAKAAQRAETLDMVKSATGPVRLLLDAAAGDVSALSKLDPDLKAFVASYLDDEQRAELAKANVADVISELHRFRELGGEERANTERDCGLRPTKVRDPLDVAPLPAPAPGL